MTFRIQSVASTTIVRCYGETTPAPWDPPDVEAVFAYDPQCRTAWLRTVRGDVTDREWADVCMVALLLGATSIATDNMAIGALFPGGVIVPGGTTRVDISALADALTRPGTL